MGALSIRETGTKLEYKFGFTRRDSRDTMFELWIAGKKVALTKTSHEGSGKGEIGDTLQAMMAKQTNMPSRKCFYDGIKCTYSKRQYYEHLATVHPDHKDAILAVIADEPA